MFNRKKRYNRLVEQRDSVQIALAKALADNDMNEYHRLNGHLIWLEEKIRKVNIATKSL